MAAGLPAYEVSNHARPGQESRHNLIYWRYQEHSAIGPGAHGRRGGNVAVRHRKPENWLEAIARNGHGIQTEAPLDAATRATEAMLMGLRLAEGVDLDALSVATGIGVDTMIDGAAVERLSKLGLIARTDSRLTVSPAGMLLLDSVLGEIVA
jgi:oxygen-independent coproporphyrinogen-3 oxidase